MRIEQIAAVDDQRACHCTPHFLGGEPAELFPLGDDDRGVGTSNRVEDGLALRRTAQALTCVRDRIPGPNDRALGKQTRRDHEAWSIPQVVGIRLEREPEDRDRLAAQLAEMLLELRDQAALLQLVHLDHGREQLEVVARIARELLERGHVLAEAAPAPTHAGAQEMRAEPMVQADAARHVHDVRADELAHVRDLVDEADPRRQEGVRRELDELGRGDVRADDLRLDAAVELDDALAVVARERADDDAVRAHEVRDRAALGQELGVRHVAEPAQATRVEPGAHVLARADRHGALHHDDRISGKIVRQLVDDRPDGAQVSVAGVGRRRPHGDEE